MERLERSDLRHDRDDDRLGARHDGKRSVVELGPRIHHQRVVRRPRGREDQVHLVRTDETARLRCSRGSENRQPALVLHRVGAQEIRLPERLLVSREVCDRELRLEVEVRRHLPELEVEVGDEHPARRARGEPAGDVDRDHGRPDAALRTEARDDAPSRRNAILREGEWGEVARALEADQQRLDPGLQLAGVERLRDHVVGTRLEVPYALLDVVGLAHAQDRDRREGRGAADLAADIHSAARAGTDIHDHEGEFTGPPDGVVRVGRRSDLVSDPDQRALHRRRGIRVRLEEEDGAGRHAEWSPACDGIRPKDT